MTPCERCGSRYEPRNQGTPQRFCSPHCRVAAYQEKIGKSRPTESKCEICQQPYTPKATGREQRWCSRDCRREAKNKPVVTKQCRMCGKDFETFRGNQVLCGTVCAKANTRWRRIEALERQPEKKKKWRELTRLWAKAHTANRRTNCRWCNAEIVGRAYAVYCNQRCMHARKKSMSPEEWTRALTEVRQELRIKKTLEAHQAQCLWCGDDFDALPGDVYCSEDCQTEDAIERMKEAS